MMRRVKRIHFTGIGGIGMSGIAELLHNQGFHVQGSDVAENANVRRLRSLGIPVWIGHHPDQLGNAQVVVISSAISSANPEVRAAHARGIPVIPRAEMLAELMRMKHGIAVAGSHGKTTITSMIAHGMEVAEMDPTYVIGGRLIASGTNARLGESDFLVAEADESDGSFLRLTPMIAVVSNIDREHMEHYGSFEKLMEAFRLFVGQVPFYGRAILHHEHPNVAALRDGLHKPVTTYGSSPQADISLTRCRPSQTGQTLWVQLPERDRPDEFFLQMPGRHNAENALAAIAVMRELDISLELIRRALKTFAGIERRFQCTPAGPGILVDDYAHHPREIMATLAGARNRWPERRFVTLFQPHRYTRSRDLMQSFFGAFDVSDEVVILPIYAASEEPIEGVTSEAIVDGIRSRGHRSVTYCEDFQTARTIAEEALAKGHIVLVMGAGSIGGLAADLRQKLKEDRT
jgi:UDP-N-acetylmuramate--alanine ligase